MSAELYVLKQMWIMPLHFTSCWTTADSRWFGLLSLLSVPYHTMLCNCPRPTITLYNITSYNSPETLCHIAKSLRASILLKHCKWHERATVDAILLVCQPSGECEGGAAVERRAEGSPGSGWRADGPPKQADPRPWAGGGGNAHQWQRCK